LARRTCAGDRQKIQCSELAVPNATIGPSGVRELATALADVRSHYNARSFEIASNGIVHGTREPQTPTSDDHEAVRHFAKPDSAARLEGLEALTQSEVSKLDIAQRSPGRVDP